MSKGREQTVLLTGGTGFVGAKLVRSLIERDRSVVLVRRSSSDMTRISDLFATRGDRLAVCNLEDASFEALLERHAVTDIVHLATAYGRKGEALDKVVEANVLFPLRILQAAVAHGVRSFIAAGSFFTKAEQLTEGQEAYILTKRQFSDCGRLLSQGRPIRYIDARLEHVYGPGDNEDKFVPALLRAFKEKRSSFAMTGGEQVRDFVYVDDVVAALNVLLDNRDKLPPGPTEIDVGTGQPMRLVEFVRLAAELTGASTRLALGELPYRRGEVMRSVADPSTLHRLGWMPRVGVRKGLQRTIDR